MSTSPKQDAISIADVSMLRGVTTATKIWYRYPSKLLCIQQGPVRYQVVDGPPDEHQSKDRRDSCRKLSYCRIYWIQYGGGAVDGDSIRLQLKLSLGACVQLLTQGAMMAYPKRDVAQDFGLSATPSIPPAPRTLCELVASVQHNSLLIVAPDPVILFRDADMRQRNLFFLDHKASLLYVDWMCSGRKSRGETWKFSLFRNECEIHVAAPKTVESQNALHTIVVKDNTELSHRDGFSTLSMRMGRFHSFATIYILGPRLFEAAQHIESIALQHQKDQAGNSTLIAISRVVRYSGIHPEKAGNLVIRIAAESMENAKVALYECLAPLTFMFGSHLYDRRG